MRWDLTPRPGLDPIWEHNPRLTPWAIVCRCSAPVAAASARMDTSGWQRAESGCSSRPSRLRVRQDPAMGVHELTHSCTEESVRGSHLVPFQSSRRRVRNGNSREGAKTRRRLGVRCFFRSLRQVPPSWRLRGLAAFLPCSLLRKDRRKQSRHAATPRRGKCGGIYHPIRGSIRSGNANHGSRRGLSSVGAPHLSRRRGRRCEGRVGSVVNGRVGPTALRSLPWS